MNDRISLGDAERKFILGIYRAAVDYYKPRIEKKTDVSLGEIAVWDYSEMHKHVLGNHIGNTWISRAVRWLPFGKQSDFRSKAYRLAFDEQASKHCAAYYKKGIYVSFCSNTAHEEAVAAAVVHKLSHALWERLATRPLNWRPRRKFVEKYRLFVEGFATYAERLWFLDLYPNSVRKMVQRSYCDPHCIYCRGLRRIEDIVRHEGQQILLQIPKRWQSL